MHKQMVHCHDEEERKSLMYGGFARIFDSRGRAEEQNDLLLTRVNRPSSLKKLPGGDSGTMK